MSVGDGPLTIVSPTTATVSQDGSFQILTNRPTATITTGPLPPGITLEGGTLHVAPDAPTGTNTIEITVTDGGESVTQTLTLTVTPPNANTGQVQPVTTTTSVTNPDGSTTTTTTVKNPDGTITSTTTNVPQGGGTPTVTQTTTGSAGSVNADVVSSINELPDKLGLEESHPTASGESFANQGTAVGALSSGLGMGFNAPNISGAPLIFGIQVPSKMSPGAPMTTLTYEQSAPTTIQVSTSPPPAVQPFLFVIRYLVGLMATIAFWRACCALFKNL